MEFPYPDADTTSISTMTITVHVALLITAIAPILLLFWQCNRLARKTDAWVFLFCLVGGPVAFIAVESNISEYSRPFVVGYFIFFEVVSITALIVVNRRLRNDGYATPTGSILIWLVVCGLLIMLLLPGVPRAREAAKRTQCMNNLKQFGLGMYHYYDTHKQFPFPIQHPKSKTPVSWRVALTPFMEQQELSEKYQFDQLWNSPANAALAKEYFPGMACPSWEKKDFEHNTDENGNALTAYSLPIGEGTFFGNGKQTRTPKDAVSNSSTIMIVEATGQNIPWSQPRDVSTDELPIGINLPGKQKGWSHGIMSSHHPNYAQVTMLDGSVTGFSSETDPEYLEALLSGKAEQEILDEYEN